MRNIMLLDTSIGTGNVGDNIIMECVEQELSEIIGDSFVFKMPTHLPAFSTFSVWRNSSVVQMYTHCVLKFAGGSNLLVKDLKTHYPQWNIHPFNSKPLRGTILVGVGAGKGNTTNSYTTKLYQQVLNHDYYHSVRDERSKEYVESLGLKAINTGCATMWMLTPDFCKFIPREKASRAVIAVTGKSKGSIIDKNDQLLINIAKKNYQKVYFWTQGVLDYDYFKELQNTESIEIVPPNISRYDHLLQQDDLDYIGTRLHGGIYAMRHKKRAIIIGIDERAAGINEANHLNYIDESEIETRLEEYINSSIETKVQMPFDEIERWKNQFYERK